MFGVFNGEHLVATFHDESLAHHAVDGTSWEVKPVVEVRSKMLIAESPSSVVIKQAALIGLIVMVIIGFGFIIARDIQQEHDLRVMRQVIIAQNRQMDNVMNVLLGGTLSSPMRLDK